MDKDFENIDININDEGMEQNFEPIDDDKNMGQNFENKNGNKKLAKITYGVWGLVILLMGLGVGLGVGNCMKDNDKDCDAYKDAIRKIDNLQEKRLKAAERIFMLRDSLNDVNSRLEDCENSKVNKSRSVKRTSNARRVVQPKAQRYSTSSTEITLKNQAKNDGDVIVGNSCGGSNNTRITLEQGAVNNGTIYVNNGCSDCGKVEVKVQDKKKKCKTYEINGYIIVTKQKVNSR